MGNLDVIELPPSTPTSHEYDNDTPTTTKPSTTLNDLPAEIHLAISQRLTYPDALSLKHTCRYFYDLVDTGIKLKVEWLVERHTLHLECPNDRCCDLRSDLKFCRGSVRLLMQRRREHLECESRPGLGCLVYGTEICTHRKKLTWGRRYYTRWLRAHFTVELWWILLALVPVLVGMFWIAARPLGIHSHRQVSE